MRLFAQIGDKNHFLYPTNIIPAKERPGLSCALKYSQMTIVFLLILLSLIVALLFLGAFFWAVKNGQYEDDFTPSVRILFDDKQTDND